MKTTPVVRRGTILDSPDDVAATDFRWQILSKTQKFWKICWRLKLTNTSQRKIAVNIQVLFLDENGFALEYSMSSPSPTLLPDKSQIYKQTVTIGPDLASRIHRATTTVSKGRAKVEEAPAAKPGAVKRLRPSRKSPRPARGTVRKADQSVGNVGQSPQPLRTFISYSHKDETLRRKLETHLKPLLRQRVIAVWTDRKIMAGEEWKGKIDDSLESADIILLLVSADFVDSDYCYGKEMTRALELHDEGKARVIPVILRDVDWHSAPFGKLQALPKNDKAVMLWRSKDSAWKEVAAGIRAVAEQIRAADQG